MGKGGKEATNRFDCRNKQAAIRHIEAKDQGGIKHGGDFSVEEIEILFSLRCGGKS